MISDYVLTAVAAERHETSLSQARAARLARQARCDQRRADGAVQRRLLPHFRRVLTTGRAIGQPTRSWATVSTTASK